MKKLLAKIRKILKDRRTRQLLTRIVSITAAVVVFITTYALVLPAITMESEANCGIPAHQHDDSCYEDRLICGQVESPGHQHTDSCYSISKSLICTETEHQHDDSCFDADGNLTCELAEHTHDDSCYEDVRELVCSIPESEGHEHTDDCYERVLACGMEAHTHSTACYSHGSELTASAPSDFAAVATTEIGSYGATVSASAETEEDSDETSTWASDESTAGGLSSTAAGAAATDYSSTATAADTASTGFDAATAEDAFVPQLEPIIFEQLLTKDTGIYYYHAEEGEEVPENSVDIADWKRVNDDTELDPADLLRVYLRYTIPAGALNATNDIARYRLPSNLHLTDQQMEAINTTVNGIANQYVNLDTLEITDTERYNTYLGIEATEGTRKPSDDINEYFTNHPDLEGQEYINAVVRAENVFDETTEEYLGQDLVFTFTPYTVQKNQHEYDADGQPTKAGQKVNGWLCFDLHMDQIDWSEPVISTIEDPAAPAQDVATENTEDTDSSDTTEATEKVASDMDEDASLSSSNPYELNTNTITEKKESSAEIVFAAKDKTLKIDEISTELHLVELNTLETENDAAQDESDQSADDSTDNANSEMTDGKDDIADDSNPEHEADKPESANEPATDTENQPESAMEINAETYPAVSFEDTITVQAGTLSTDNESATQATPAETAITVSVIAEEETFPLGTTMQLGTVEDMDTVASAVEGAVEGQTRGFHAVDISFRNADGEEIEPLKPIKVSMTSEAIKQAVKDSSTAPVVVHVENPTDSNQTILSDGDSDSKENSTDNSSSGMTETHESASLDTAVSAPADESTDKNEEPPQADTKIKSPVATLIETTETSSEENTANNKETPDTLSFDAGSFSVYAIVYTVDFHYEVNGKMYEFSIPGGGFVSLQHIVEVLGIAGDNEDTEYSAETAENDTEAGEDFAEEVPDVDIAGENAESLDNEITDGRDILSAEFSAPEEVTNLNSVPVSEAAKNFVADVTSVEFSDPELVWVGKVDSADTVGGLKEANGLECQYSAELTEEQITEINAQTVKAGDWALISVQPFRSEEMLTVTMKNGDQFVVRVTDAQDPSAYIDKEVIIYDNGEKRAMLSGGYSYDGRYRLNSIPLSEAEGNEGSHWTVERHDNNYYLKSSDNRYLTINNNDVGLVSNWSVATPLNIQAGWDPNYRISAANNDNNVLSYSTNGNWGDGYFSAPGGRNGTDNQEWLYIRVVETVADRAGDWLLYFDDDFSEITIHVGETISLRPYNKWEWKEGNVNVQTAHWNIGGKDNNYWNQININDANGAHKESWDDGGTGGTAGFHWTAYVKKDDQLDTHYWAVQGQATQVGDYVLTNTKNGKTITVHVVEGSPEPPKTINKIANIKVNLFDYDNGGALDVGLVNGQTNQNLANNNNFKNESVNQMGGSNHFYFLSSGSGNNNNESWNSYTKDRANPNIVKTELGTDGYPVLDHGNSNTSLKYLFDTSQASQSWHGGSGGNGMIAYPDVVGMFQKDNDGYYYFNSNTNYFYYNTATGTSKLYEHTYTQNSSASKGSLANDKPIGFFPFHEYNSTEDLYVNQNAALNHHVGLSMELEFMLPRDKKDDNGNDIIFDFSGDDDLWVFVEWVDDNGQKQNKLLLDLGGVHQPIHGDINFTTGSNTKFMEPNRPYTLKVFYLERGGCDSNCSIRFNLPIIQDLNVAKKLTGLTEEEKAKYRNEEFVYEILVNGQPYNYPNSHNRYEKAILRNADGEDITPENFTITNGRFTLKDGQTLTITYLDRSDTFSVAELKTPNMENFEVPNAERFYHQEHDASLYEEEITLTASNTVDEEYEDWITPEYKLEDTEKVTFTNTLKEKNLEVEKKWMGNQEHPESITFTVSATVDDGQGGRTPYAVAELKNTNGTDKVFTLNDDNDWRHEIEHLPVNTPDGKFIFYDIQEGHAEGYALTGIKDLTAENYNYCNIDVVKLWPDSNGNHTEVLQVVLKNKSEGKYYAGVDNDGKATFVDDIDDAQIRELKPGNNYSQRYDRLPYGDYSAEQLHEDEYNHGLVTYKRAIIQYDLENTPLVNPVDPEEETVTPVVHKRIDALRDGIENPDSAHTGEDLTDLYRLYLDYKIDSLQDPNGVDLLFVIDHSGSMNDSHWPGNEYRAPAVMAALNGENGIIAKFLAANDKNRWAAVGFKGPDGFRDYEFALSNPWQPKKNDDLSNDNAGQNGSEVLSSGGTSYAFTRNAASIELDNEGPLIQSNYTAGFWRAEQFLLKQDVKTDGRKKVVIFIADGVPTLHIGEPEADSLNGSLQNAGTAAGSNYYREEYGGCPDKALAEFGYFVSDLTGNGNGYVFGGDNGNIDFYAIGLGALMQTEDSSDPDDPMSGSELLNRMLSAAYGQTVPANHYMTITDAITDPDSDDYSAVTNTLSKDLRIILGLNDTFSNLVIQDDLSKYVDLYGLTAGSSASAIMNAAKAKVTMTVPDLEHPEDPPQVITLYENGAPVDDDAAKFTKADGTTKATIINRLEYVADSKTVKAVFDSEYHPAYDVTYTLSFDVKATNDAYTTYAATGYDKYTSGEHQGQTIVGDEDTDFLGTTPANATSVDKPGFRSNDEAKATYVHNDKDEEEKYPHPVIQVAAKADIVKIDQTGAALEGAKFNLYDNNYDPSKTIEENADHLIESDLQSKKPTDPAGNEAVIRNGKLIAGTYYLVETHAPDGFNSLPGPVKITVTETNGVLNMTAEIAGVPIVGYMLQKISNGVWKLQIQNSAGYELPNAGGPGTRLFTILGSILILGAGALLWRRRRMI